MGWGPPRGPSAPGERPDRPEEEAMDEPTTQSRRKPQKIRYYDQEWERIVARARACGLPPATFVRKTSLGMKLRARRNRVADDLIVELGRLGLELQRLARAIEGGGTANTPEISPVLEEVLAAVRRVG